MSKSLVYVEIDVPFCANIYGLAPCQAALEGGLVHSLDWAFLNSEINGFAAFNATFVGGTDGAIYTQTGADPRLLTPDALTVDGSVDYIMRLDIERTVERTAGSWEGSVLYSTGGHAFDGSFLKNIPEIANVAGTRVLIELDMSDLDAGGDDWITSTITRLRFDFDGSTPGGAFKIYSITIGHPASSGEATGEIKCFNSIATCQDRPNYIDDPVTLRFSEDSAHYPKEIEAIPSLVGHSMTPATVSLGRDLGQRASLSVTFKDHRWPDTAPGFDKYASERSYDPVKQGTFWGKFRSRQPFLRGRALRLIRGFAGQAIGAMETRHYVIDSFDFDAATGRYTITAKDVLKLLDGDRAQAPRLSQGFLVAGIDDDDIAATLSPAGIGDLEYPASGYVAIGGKEICSFTRSGDVLTLTRAQLGTIAIEHDAQDRVQLGLRYVAQDAAVIVEDLCTEYAGVDSSFITLVNWQAETAAFLDRVFSADLFEPTPVNQLVSELIEDAALSIWYDEVTQQIRLRVIRPISTEADTFDRNNILSETTHTREQPNERISQVWRYFAKRNPLEGQTDPDNYRSVAVTIDAEAEADYGSSAIHKIYSRWIPFGGRSIATKANDLFLSRYRDPPRRFNFHSFRGGVVTPTLGQGYRFKAIGIQDATGDEDDAPIQITRLKPGEANNEVEAEEMLASFVEDGEGEGDNDKPITIDANSFNINLRSLFQSLYGDPVGETGEGEGDGDIVTCTVEAGVVVGSTDAANPAFDVGDWPAGVDITVTVNGRIQGKGGDGGDGASGEGGALTGLAGGVALHTDYPINLEDDDGEIWGGGGGGGGGASGSPGAFPFSDVNGGGGGAGTNPGDGGDVPISFGINPGDPGTSEAGGAGNATGTIDAGDGGDPGQAGETTALGAGGAAGAAIDGISNVTTIGEAGDRRGPEIN